MGVAIFRGQITAGKFADLLERNANETLASKPEGQLILALIETALIDADMVRKDRTPKFVDARRFFFDWRLELVAGLIGLDADFVRESLAKIRPWACRA